ncbi:GEVED domain-containing protein [Pontiellaceae bacterium B12227]|nr:GEVED domain-containing protein [Pontiellaceae bacterium B12227]
MKTRIPLASAVLAIFVSLSTGSALAQNEYDFVDAPDPGYPTLLANNGARHLVTLNSQHIYLGLAPVDTEPDGQPHVNAIGDDTDIVYGPGLDDEDGVNFTTPLIPGQMAQVSVTASVNGQLDAWIDFSSNTDWTTVGDQIFTSQALAAGPNVLNFNVPVWASPGYTYARFRFNASGVSLQPVGSAPDGEVEDYFIQITQEQMDEFDWGDAPDSGQGTGTDNYQTLMADNGAFHPILIGAPFFDDGTSFDFPDPEMDGQPTVMADGDDIDALGDDEDGIVFPAPLVPGAPGSVTITVDDGMGGTGAGQGWVDAWIDFNANGDWTDAGEQIYSNWMPHGPNNVNFNVPATAVSGLNFARFRINSTGTALPPTGGAPDGEVEDHGILIEEGGPVEEFDFGDAPDTGQGTGSGNYETLLADNGAFHNIVAGTPFFDDGTLSDFPDAETDGQPTTPADGDDLNGARPDDEDGIVFGTLIPGQNGTVTITVDDGIGGFGAGGGYVDAWIDFNADGDWVDSGEQIHSGWLAQGANPITFMVSASPGTTYARFRINSQSAGLPPTGGPAVDGEVEDHLVTIEEEQLPEFDWGDAPDAPQAFPTFNTLAANNGANHLIVPGVYMGTAIDSEPDGQPNAAATGDDIVGFPDDEDGVVFQSKLIPGQQAKFDVTVSIAGWLDVWLDADNSNDWTGPNDLIFSGNVAPGLNTITPTLPQGIAGGQNYMRFRFNTGAALPFNGGAADGEVEDYAVHIESLDWGDAPTGFNTTAAGNGANHTIAAGIFMGAQIDAEPDGQHSPAADGDDLSGVPNDEDGVLFVSPIVPGQQAQFTVTVSAVGWLDIWLDTDLSGSWTAPDYIWGGAVAVGANTITVPIPYQTRSGQSYMRFRYNTAGAPLPPTGWAADGEVEDYQVIVEEPELDFGDAPDGPYSTLLGNNGAFHIISTGILLGTAIDAEPDGQPTSAADGDDANGTDDEDGVAFMGKIVAGSNGTINVTAATTGSKLDAWIDFGADGSWAGDHLWSGVSQTLTAGPNALSFAVPQPSALGPTYARFRVSSAGGLPPDNGGINTPDGEVEDYMVDLYQPAPTNLVITNLTFNASNTVATVEWTVETGILYQMQATTNLVVSNSWADVEAAVLSPLNSQTNNMSAETNKFYRVTAPWTP